MAYQQTPFVAFEAIRAYHAYAVSMASNNVLVSKWEGLSEIEREAWAAVCRSFANQAKEQFQHALANIFREK